jgi:hypothetical protein
VTEKDLPMFMFLKPGTMDEYLTKLNPATASVEEVTEWIDGI